jgi:hypothetical protein
MNPLFYVAMALSLGAIAVTVYALLSAPEGYEDEQGFHAFEAEASENGAPGAEEGEDAGVRTFYSAQ